MSGDQVKRQAIKAFLHSTLRHPEVHESIIEDHIRSVHVLTKTAYLLAKYVLTGEVDRGRLDIFDPLKVEFFVECLLSANSPDKPPSASRGTASTRDYRTTISDYLENFQRSYPAARLISPIPYAQQICLYQGRAMWSAYVNNIEAHLTSYLQHTVNIAFKSRQKLRDIQKSRCTSEEKKKLIAEHRKRTRAVKQHLLEGKSMDLSVLDENEQSTISKIKQFTEDDFLARGSLTLQQYILRNPECQIRRAILLSRYIEEIGERTFVSCPIRSSSIPCYAQIDTKILCQNILRMSSGEMSREGVYQNKFSLWNKVFRLDKRPFKNSSLSFHGTIYTDAVGITVMQQSQATRAGGCRKRKLQAEEEDKDVDSVSPADLQRLLRKAVYVDPNKRDLLYCVSDGSCREKGWRMKFRYTSQDRIHHLRSKQLKRKRARLPESIRHAERALSLTNSKSTSRADIEQYMQTLSPLQQALSHYYANKRYRRQKMEVYINNQREDSRLIDELSTSFGKDATFIIGNYSNPNVRFHAPARGVGFRRLLRKNGFKVLILDEFRSSSYCPECKNRVAPFLKVVNPRPHRRQQHPTVLCHGLLRCSECNRIWNRDMLACLNFRYIVREMASGHGRPFPFSR